MKKLLVIKSSKESTWGSCRVISPNLLMAYEKNKDNFEIEYFEIPENFLKEEIEDKQQYIVVLIEKIKQFKPDSLVFVDHLPHPVKILNSLLFFVTLRELPSIVFHMYGDFTYFARDWSRLSDKFKGHNVKFIVASEAQQNLMKFFVNDSCNVERFLFPVNEEEYYFSQDERIQLRNEMKIRDDENVILYSGRISLQKNVDILVREFSHIVQGSKFSVHLWIVGAFDDIGATFMGVKNYEGFMYAKMEKIISALPPEVARMVHFWGIQKKSQLRKIKAASDMFISLSLYHDEDYGMSPAEALSCGLPTLLTNWGGYYSFESNKWLCKLVPVEITSFGHKMQISKIHEFYKNYTLAYINEYDRMRWSLEFQKEFSVTSSAKKLKDILDKDFQPFNGFHWNLMHYSTLYWSVDIGKEINVQMNPSRDNFYYQVYKNYIKQINTDDQQE